MSLQKKNVIQGFIREEYVPTPEQFLVKYTSGKGNNLHEVECFDGNSILVSMPKKYRQTVWLKKDDCLVIDPIEEGKKVKGEIFCLLPDHAVRDLLTTKQWPTPGSNCITTDAESLLKFFERSKMKREEFNPFPSSSSSSSSDSSDVETETEEGNEVDDDDNQVEEQNGGVVGGESGVSLGIIAKENGNNNNTTSESLYSHNDDDDDDEEEELDDLTRDRNRSRVQLVTSGIVTVTNVLSDGFENDIQSLEFEADEEDEEANNRDIIHRQANTIRIQVNYDNAN